MEPKKPLIKHLRKLHRTLQKLVARSHEFADFRKFLREEQIELAIYVVPMLNGKPAADELHFELTESDKSFLKQAGITF